MASPAASETCPVCHAYLVRGRDRCVSCGMAVGDMANLRAIERRAAERRRSTAAGPSWTRRGVALAVGLLVAVLIFYVYRGGASKPANVWAVYPGNSNDLVKRVFECIAEDTNAAHDEVYALVTPALRHPENPEERGLYRQLFHEIDRYLTGEFGASWNSTAVIRPRLLTTPADWDYEVEIGPEKLHVELGRGVAPDGSVRYGFSGIQEFPLSIAGGAQKGAGAAGALKAVGAGGAAETVQGLAALGQGRRSPMETKRQVLPLVRQPESPFCKKAIYQLWPVRTDPVVRARLEKITTDARYAPELQQLARHVLDENVPEEELVGAGVQDLR